MWMKKMRQDLKKLPRHQAAQSPKSGAKKTGAKHGIMSSSPRGTAKKAPSSINGRTQKSLARQFGGTASPKSRKELKEIWDGNGLAYPPCLQGVQLFSKQYVSALSELLSILSARYVLGKK